MTQPPQQPVYVVVQQQSSGFEWTKNCLGCLVVLAGIFVALLVLGLLVRACQ